MEFNPIYEAAELLTKVAFGWVNGAELRGLDNVPRSGRAIVACNHISNWDPVFLAYALCRTGRRPHFLGKREAFLPVASYALRRLHAIPLDRSRGDVGALKQARRLLERGELLALFPEGTRAKGRVLRAKPGLGYLAEASGSLVVPARIWGTLGYPRERLRIRFGPARRFDAFQEPGNGRSKYQAIADAVLEDIRAMAWEG